MEESWISSLTLEFVCLFRDLELIWRQDFCFMGHQAVVKHLLPRLLLMRQEPISFTSRSIPFTLILILSSQRSSLWCFNTRIFLFMHFYGKFDNKRFCYFRALSSSINMLEKVSWQFVHYSVVQELVHHAYFSLMRLVAPLLESWECWLEFLFNLHFQVLVIALHCFVMVLIHFIFFRWML